MEHAKYFIVLTLFTIFSFGCASKKNEPSENDIIENLGVDLPHYITLKTIKIDASVNTGNEVEPSYSSRFSGKAKITEPLYQVKTHILGKAVLEETVSKGVEISIYGVARSNLNIGKWAVSFESLDIAPKINGSPLSKWNANEFIQSGSNDENRLLAEQEKLRAEKTRREEKEKKHLQVKQEASQNKVDKHIQSLFGTWKGEYICEAGATGLTLELSSVSSTMKAIFTFYPTKGNPNSKSGAFSMSGHVDDSGNLNLKPNSWIKRPSGYQMVGLKGGKDSAGKNISGTVQSRGCSSFELKKTQ
jgi:hypothetical protein